MPTEKQRAANRHNAQKSTGPQTPGGKYISSQNAIIHGCLALHTAYLNTFPPHTQETLGLIETLTVARWRLRRIWTLEALSRHESRYQRSYNQALDRLLKIQAAKPENPARQSAKRENVDTKPIFDTNKGLTPNQKPIQSLSEASTKPERTGVKPGSNPHDVADLQLSGFAAGDHRRERDTPDAPPFNGEAGHPELLSLAGKVDRYSGQGSASGIHARGLAGAQTAMQAIY